MAASVATSDMADTGVAVWRKNWMYEDDPHYWPPVWVEYRCTISPTRTRKRLPCLMFRSSYTTRIFCRENRCSTAAINEGQMFFAGHCDEPTTNNPHIFVERTYKLHASRTRAADPALFRNSSTCLSQIFGIQILCRELVLVRVRYNTLQETTGSAGDMNLTRCYQENVNQFPSSTFLSDACSLAPMDGYPLTSSGWMRRFNLHDVTVCKCR
eukprot:scaffold14617_cov37-Prasinocladus_malaysianus.AAC.2